MGHLELYHISVFATVNFCWIALAAMFLFRNRPPRAARLRLDRNFLPGLILQAAGFAFTWGLRRQLFTHLVELPPAFEIALALFAVVLAVASVVFTTSAIRTLGKQWSVAARTVEEHALITAGPYRIVRHPIYTGLFGMLVATGLSISQWEGLAAGAALYAAGSFIRIGSEERLLRERFGSAFEEYCRRVPAFIPFVK